MTAQPRPTHQLVGDQFERIAKALSDPRRVAVLEAISREQDCPCQQLVAEFPVSKATISHHLKELSRAGIVDTERQGQFVRCRVRREVLEAYAAELLRRVAGPCELEPTRRK